MSATAPNRSTESEWRESLLRSKAQIAAGQTVPLLPILERLLASADRLEGLTDIDERPAAE